MGVTSKACQLDVGNVDSALGNWVILPEFIPELQQPQKSIFLSSETGQNQIPKGQASFVQHLPRSPMTNNVTTSGFSQDHRKHLRKEKGKEKKVVV